MKKLLLIITGLILAISISVTLDDYNIQKKGVDIIYITDDSCKICFDINIYRDILIGRYKVIIRSEKYTDISEQNDIIQKYNITKVPTIILENTDFTPTKLDAAWLELGTAHGDTLVFRNHIFNNPRLGDYLYKDLQENALFEGGG